MVQVRSWSTDQPEGCGHREKLWMDASSMPHVPCQTQWHEATGKDCCGSTVPRLGELSVPGQTLKASNNVEEGTLF